MKQVQDILAIRTYSFIGVSNLGKLNENYMWIFRWDEAFNMESGVYPSLLTQPCAQYF